MSSRKPPSNSGDWDDFEIPTWDDSAASGSSRRSQPSSPGRSGPSGRQAYPDPLYEDYEASAPPARQKSGSAAGNQPPARLSNRVPTRSTRPSPEPYRDPYGGFEEEYAGDAAYPEREYAPQEPSPGDANQYDLYAGSAAVDSGWDQAAVYEEVPRQRRGRSSRQRSRPPRPTVSIARPAFSDGTLGGIVGAALLGLLVMAGVVWWGIGDLSTTIPWHLNASGDVDLWISSSGLWRIPFGVLVSMILAVTVGAYLWKRDRFAARFFVVSICIVQLLAWVAVVDQLW